MENVKNNNTNLPAEPQHKDEKMEFKGYTLDELRYQRALVTLKKTFIREKLTAEAIEMRDRIPFVSSVKDGVPKAKGVVGKIINGMNYMDYVMLGISAFSYGKKIFSFFRRKK
ncbi:MAG: hypothetical protein HDS93_04890 [Bacteroidales bacterium]|nr:hypothetical protein [Bacteroidales bacterium]MBD5191176.1 hypothetical protein [Bacteroidales bacterium]MDE6084203.1 hypothetical protein [Muribaculaceae bacterium]